MPPTRRTVFPAGTFAPILSLMAQRFGISGGVERGQLKASIVPPAVANEHSVIDQHRSSNPLIMSHIAAAA